ncbi:MAG: adenylate cyclase [Deltaproteobacteria bacterium CG11_big_fil_rev_8_21_14_0_20_47_16]|nr:MAG: adenylate cyclase [Deltaproteobacteria bacterium CG11_big_fil_rev_8_21_14_0_20_47_16]
MPNIEIKAHLANPEKAHAAAKAAHGEYVGQDHQIDTYFCTPHGRLKLRESSLSGAQLIPYMRTDQSGPKKSTYALIPIAEPSTCKQLLTDILGVEAIVDKMRDIYLIGNVRVHIDTVVGLGSFLEFEAVYKNPADEAAEHAKVVALMEKFGVEQSHLLTGSYREMVNQL